MSWIRFSTAGAALGALLVAGCERTPTGVDLGERLEVGSAALHESDGGTTFSGQATGVRATVLGLETVLGDTGPLPEEGGAIERELLTVTIPDLLTAHVGTASTVGQGNKSHSASSVADVELTVAGNTIVADFLGAEATAICNEDGTVSLFGRSHIARLKINGQVIEVTGAPNQRVDLPVGYVIINEQTRETNDDYGAITVNALHVVVPGTADIVIASAHADIHCDQADRCTPIGDFVTGGGWIDAPSGGRGTFGAGGGIKQNGLWGHLVYKDHGADLRVQGTSVTDYEVLGPTTRRFAGTAEMNGKPGTYEVIVSDNHDGGRGSDEFEIRFHSADAHYAAFGVLRGGNIQLHPKPCQ